jgi:hypothetical protein
MHTPARRLAVLCVLFASACLASAATFSWNGPSGGNMNWTDPTNWLSIGLPGPNDTALFDTVGESGLAGLANADNIVDSNFTISSLWYAATNLSPNFAFHNTEINSGVTLTVSNTTAAIVLDSGTQTDPAVTPPGATACYNTIGGGGTLAVTDTNTESVMVVSQGSSTYSGDAGLWATLDMSALNTFNGTFGRLLVGIQGVGATPGEVSLVGSGRQSGQLSLAATNIIHLTQVGNVQGTGSAAAGGPALVINDSPFFGDYGSDLYLGQSNALYADTITVGRIQCSRTAIMEFNPNLAAPYSLLLRGESSNRVAELIVGDNTVNGGACNAPPGAGIIVPPGGFQVGSAGLFDVSAGTSDMMIDTLIIGKGYAAPGGGYGAGIFSMGAGTLNVNTLELGVMSAANENAPATGTLNIIGGSVVVNSAPVALGVTLGSSVTTYATGGLNIYGGSINAANGAYGIIDDGLSLSEVTLSNATVTAANIGTVSAPIGTVTMGDSALNLSLNGLQGAVVADHVTTTSTSVGNTINITSISGFVGEQAAITIIQSDNPITYSGTFTGGAGGSDFVLGTLPAGYLGHLQVNPSSVQLILTQSPIVPNAWTGTGIASHNTNWSDTVNWSAATEPNSANAAFFVTTGSVGSSALSSIGGGPGAILPARINNIVDGNVTVLGMDYANTNGSFQNTSISNGVTLTVGQGGLTVGSSVVDEGNTTANATISGAGGTLNINNTSAAIYVGLGHSNAASTAQATLDMSGLGTFNADAGSLLIGVGSVGFTSVLQPVGTVYLAQTNNITVTAGNGSADAALVALDVGDAGDAETAAVFGNNAASSLFLGKTNGIFADYIDVGRQWASAAVSFNPTVTNANPTAYIRGASASAVVRWSIGDGAGNLLSSGGGAGSVDLTGGSVDALVNTLNVAESSPNCTTATTVETGTLTFNAGTIAATTVNVSDNPAPGGIYYSPAAGSINVNGTGTLTVSGTLNLGLTPGAQSGGTPTATLNIKGGSVLANTVAAGGNGTVSTINIAGGTLAASNGIATPLAPVTSLDLTNATIVEGASAIPFINAGSVSLGGASNTIVILSLPAIEVYPATVTVIQSSNAILGAFNLQVVLSTNYSGLHLAESADHTAVLLTIQSGPVTGRGIVDWVGPDGTNILWTDSRNWHLPPIPAAPDTAYFDNAGVSASPGAANVDNIVNTNTTIAALWYAATNVSPSFGYHNTVINPGVTLTVSNTTAAIVYDTGTQTDPSAGTTGCYNTISGGGTLTVVDTNSESVMICSQGSSSYHYPSAGLWAAMDMSGLNNFNGTFGRLLLGIQGAGPTAGQVTLLNAGRQTGRLSLAATNVIHLTQPGNIQGGSQAAAGGPALVVLDSGFFGDNGSILTLGLANAIYADSITIGRNGALQSGVMQFNPNFTGTPESLLLRGQSASRVSEFIVADGTFNPNSSQYEFPDPRIVVTPQISGGLNDGESAIVDVSEGTSDIMVDTLILAKGYTAFGGGYAVGQFNLGAGTLNVNTLQLGVVSSPAASGAQVTGILNVSSNGLVIANNELALGVSPGAATTDLAAGVLNVTNGTVQAASIAVSGSTNSSITINASTLTLSSPGSIGAPGAPLGSITLVNGTTLNLAAGGFPTILANNIIGSGSTDTINLTKLPPISHVPSTNTLIQALNGAISGYDFVLGSPLPTGYHGYIQPSADGTAVQLVVTNATFPAKGVTITSARLQAGSIVLAGTNGLAGTVYYVLGSTNLAAPLATRWVPVATNSFDGSGNFNINLPTSNPYEFFRIESQ